MTVDEIRAIAAARKAARERATQGPKSFGQSLWENIVGDDDPTTQNTGERIGSFLNKAGESMTLGLAGDETSAALESLLPGVDYEDRRDHYRQQEEILERENPGLAMTAEIGGAMVPALTGIGAAGTLARGAGILPRAAASTAAGAGQAGTYAAMEGEGLEDRASQGRQGAMIGAGVGLAAPFIGAGVQKLADSRVGRAAMKRAAQGAPTTQALREQARAAYSAVDDAGVQIRPDVFSGAMDDTVSRLSAKGLDDLPGPGSLTPMSARAVQIGRGMSEEMAGDPTAALPFSSLDKLRRHAGTAAGNMGNKTDSAVGSEMVGSIDDLVRNLGPDDLVEGDAAALQSALPKARDLWARMSRSQTIDDAMEQSQNYLSGDASGIRNQFARILRNEKLSRGFSDAEKKIMRQVVNGSAPKRILDLLGGGLGGLFSMAGGATIGATGGPAGSALGTLLGAGLATGAKKGSEALTRKQAEALRAIIANGGLDKLPVATDQSRRIVEGLMRRGGAVAAQ